MANQISREQASKLMAKSATPHNSRFKSKDVNKELIYKYKNSGKATLIFDKMMPKETAETTEASVSARKHKKLKPKPEKLE